MFVLQTLRKHIKEFSGLEEVIMQFSYENDPKRREFCLRHSQCSSSAVSVFR